MTAEYYILCEGYHDRAFWKGLLLHIGCTDPSNEGRQSVVDPWKKSVRGGQYAFISPSGRFIRLVAVGGDRNLLHNQFRHRVDKRHIEKLYGLIVSADADVHNDDELIRVSLPVVSQWALEIDPSRAEIESHVVLSDETPISVLTWMTNTAENSLGVPAKQTLERMVCSAIVAAYGERGRPVEEWLASRPNPPVHDSPKAHAFSYVAGWYAASASYEGAIASIWRDQRVAKVLVQMLEDQPAWLTIRDWLT